MLLILDFVFVFVIGAAIGSFLNVCIYRLPLEKSILWPGSRCGHCLQPIRLRDNIPLLSYWLLRGRCRKCGKAFSIQYFLVELLTALGFTGIFYLTVIANVHDFPVLAVPGVADGDIPWEGWIVFAHHAILFSFLIVVAVCDFQWREIPLSVTMTGTLVGLVFAACFPWPWPLTPAAALPRLPPGMPWWMMFPLPGAPRVGMGLYAWPVWGPPPDWIPAGSWQLGVATGLAGALFGTLLLRWVRIVATKAMGLGEALGLGDADLMMMAGAFLGWQPVVVAFLISAFPALLLSVILLFRYGDRSVTFGPSLAIGILITCLIWPSIGPQLQILFFNGQFLLILAGGGTVFLLVASLVIRVWRRLRGVEPAQ
jgi:leader peptidase (prepilin peptidase)/N-methyltransferase